MPEVLPILVKQQDGTEYAVQLGFNEAHETVEHFPQGGVQGDHFEDLRLSFAQQLGLLARGDVTRDADETEDFVLVVPQGEFRGRKAFPGAGGVDDHVLLHVDHWLPGVHDLLLDVEKMLGHLRGMEIKIRLADHVIEL